MVQILLMLEVLFTQESKVEALFCGASSGPEPFHVGLNVFIVFTTCIYIYYNMLIFRIGTKAYCLFNSSPDHFMLDLALK